jgi:hypothetical protein
MQGCLPGANLSVAVSFDNQATMIGPSMLTYVQEGFAITYIQDGTRHEKVSQGRDAKKGHNAYHPLFWTIA